MSHDKGTSVRAGTNEVRITLIGGPTVFIEIGPEPGPLRLLTDPTFEPAGYRYQAGGHQDVLKTISPAVEASAVGPVDAVLLSHDQHNDNLDPAGRAYLAQARQTLTTPAGAERLGANVRGVATWETVTLAGADGLDVRVTSMPARHGPQEVAPAAGDVSGWMIEWEGQRRGGVYVSGDTVLFEGLEEIARRYRVGVALLHLGAAQARRFGQVHLTLTSADGARFATMLGQAIIIPIHFEGWTHYTEGHHEIEQAFAEAGIESRLRFLPAGRRVTIEV